MKPALHRIAAERIGSLWNGGNGLGGADLLMASVGAGLQPYTRFRRVEYANGEEMPPEAFLREVEGVVLGSMLKEIFDLPGLGGRCGRPCDPVLRPVALHLRSGRD